MSNPQLSGCTPQPPTTSTPNQSSSKSTPKALNVFTNDGSFLERFQRTKKEEEEKKKSEDALARKRDFNNRFKNRGKRPPPDSSDDSTATAENPSVKRHKFDDKPLSDVSLAFISRSSPIGLDTADYEKQVKSYAGRSLKDNGIGVRPLVK